MAGIGRQRFTYRHKTHKHKISLCVAAVVLMVFSAGVQAGAARQSSGAEDVSAKVAPLDEISQEELRAQSAALLKQAEASPSGIASVTLKRYPRHFTMLTVRTRSGGAELHEHTSDIFVVLDGEATEVVGGTIPDSKVSAPGEVRGARVVGGTEHAMRTGDIVHISAGTPHQTLVAPGKTFTYYVIKVEQ